MTRPRGGRKSRGGIRSKIVIGLVLLSSDSVLGMDNGSVRLPESVEVW